MKRDSISIIKQEGNKLFNWIITTIGPTYDPVRLATVDDCVYKMQPPLSL